jgi:hypothetical protein
LSMMSGPALKRVKPTRWAKPKNDFTAATQLLRVAVLTGRASAVIVSKRLCEMGHTLCPFAATATKQSNASATFDNLEAIAVKLELVEPRPPHHSHKRKYLARS